MNDFVDRLLKAPGPRLRPLAPNVFDPGAPRLPGGDREPFGYEPEAEESEEAEEAVRAPALGSGARTARPVEEGVVAAGRVAYDVAPVDGAGPVGNGDKNGDGVVLAETVRVAARWITEAGDRVRPNGGDTGGSPRPYQGASADAIESVEAVEATSAVAAEASHVVGLGTTSTVGADTAPADAESAPTVGGPEKSRQRGRGKGRRKDGRPAGVSPRPDASPQPTAHAASPAATGRVDRREERAGAPSAAGAQETASAREPQPSADGPAVDSRIPLPPAEPVSGRRLTAAVRSADVGEHEVPGAARGVQARDGLRAPSRNTSADAPPVRPHDGPRRPADVGLRAVAPTAQERQGTFPAGLPRVPAKADGVSEDPRGGPGAPVRRQPGSHREDHGGPVRRSAAAPPPAPPDAAHARPVRIDGSHVDFVYAEAEGVTAPPPLSPAHAAQRLPSPPAVAPSQPPPPAADAAPTPYVRASQPATRRAAEPPPPAPVVRVTIDHLVVRTAPPRAVDQEPAAHPVPLLDLEEYLRTRRRA
ncbi:hypothetical protein ACH41E_25485 [Streptomyces sp. NPDC020412]|uniref:hypothetical protein n=1 Tax=Streptomyces sp. NPDC020412 TaxID=3365073 RepID=UPI0037AF25C4